MPLGASELGAFLAELEHAGTPPRWEPGRLRAAWEACDDVTTMIAVLRRGGTMGVFEIDSLRESRRGGVVEHWLFRLLSAGRYRRIDVGPEDGGDAVRRCFPDFPDDWGAALDARLAVMEPLDRLRSDLENGRPPRIDEATERAWAVCKDPMQMLVLLRTLGHASAASQLVDALPELPRDGLVVSAEWMRRAAAVVRARFPRIPACDAAGGLVR